MKPLRDLSLIFLSFCIALASGLYLAGNSAQLRALSAYTQDEPHPVGPTWEAAARKDLWNRCSRHYAGPVSQCSAYNVWIDSTFIRLAGALRHTQPAISDPEFVEPNLQRDLVLKRGVFVSLLIGLSFFLLTRFFGNPFWAALPLLLWLSTPEIQSRGFEINVNGEFGAAIFFLFCMSLSRSRFRASFLGSCFAGLIAAIKLPLVAMALPGLSWGVPLVGFLASLAFSYGGVLGSFHDVLGLRIGLLASGSDGINSWDALRSGWSATTANLPSFLTLFIGSGLILLLKNASNKDRLRLLAWTTLSVLALKNPNSQPRYFVGFTGIFCLLAIVGLWETRKLIFQKVPTRFCVWVERGSLIIASMITLGIALPHANLRPFWTSPTYVFSENERIIQSQLSRLSTKVPLYIDKRIRLNTEAGPFADANIITIDPLTDWNLIPNGASVSTLCYALGDSSGPTGFGVGKNDDLAEAIFKQCTAKQLLAPGSLISAQNGRLVPAIQDFKLVLFQKSSTSVAQPLLIQFKSPGEKLLLHTAFFKINGKTMQNWGTQIRNYELEREPKNHDFSIEKNLILAPGTYEIEVSVQSTFVGPAKLILEGLGETTPPCEVGTAEAQALGLFAEFGAPPALRKFLRSMPFFGPKLVSWGRRPVPVACHFQIKLSQGGEHGLRLRIDSAQDIKGYLRFNDVAISGR